MFMSLSKWLDIWTSGNINYWYNLGSLLGLCLVIQMVSGILLSTFYSYTMGFDSVDRMIRELSYGYELRSMHSCGALLFFLMVYLHMFRGLWKSSYKGNKWSAWVIGVMIFLLMMVSAFLGYSLPYGNMSYWAVTVMTNLLTAMPYLGIYLLENVLGGYSVSDMTLGRFYSFHFLLPLLMGVLVLMHIWLLHNSGGSNNLGLESSMFVMLFNPYFVMKDYYGFNVYLLFKVFYIWMFEEDEADNYMEANSLVTPSHMVPHIYLLAYYNILRSMSDKLLGVVLMLLSILILMLLPMLNISLRLGFLLYMKWLILSMTLNFLLMVWNGSNLIEYPYISIGSYTTFYYFWSILCGLFVISLLENVLLEF